MKEYFCRLQLEVIPIYVINYDSLLRYGAISPFYKDADVRLKCNNNTDE